MHGFCSLACASTAVQAQLAEEAQLAAPAPKKPTKKREKHDSRCGFYQMPGITNGDLVMCAAEDGGDVCTWPAVMSGAIMQRCTSPAPIPGAFDI